METRLRGETATAWQRGSEDVNVIVKWWDALCWRWKLSATYRTVLKMYWGQVERTKSLEREVMLQRSVSADLGKRLHEAQKELKSAFASDVPGLTPGEIERLALLAEECGEMAQAIGKILRFGWESSSPYRGLNAKTNRVALEQEIGNMRAVVNLMLDSGDVRLSALQSWQRNKKAALEKWTLYQECSMPRAEQLAMMAAIVDSAGIER